ncbi:MAG: DUF1553 domain-containing protein, partial [Planctomycetales bacterium]|nr:DUF1553 domain-containing protein [Planctomycetales bacterium]
PPLSADELAIIRDWIQQGATWPDAIAGEELDPRQHWAFQSVVAPAVPTVASEHWVRNPIDRFVLARLEQNTLTPSPEADRSTLVRRLYLDLIGLPPTPQQVEEFVYDNRSEAYDALVERLLNSVHYGERWGRTWLDSARYADSDGYEKDKVRSVWSYRDWVVSALNRDLGYDRFIIEQLAGDLLPDATQEQRVATGFLRNSMINEEGGIDPEQFRMAAMFDRMDAVGKSILGLTIQCAQCHSHKYDPLTQREYYQIFAFLNNDHEANIPVYDAQQQQQRSRLYNEIAAIELSLKQRTPDWQTRQSAWEAEQRAFPDFDWQVLTPDVDDNSNGGQKYLLQPDGSYLCQGYAPTHHTVLMTTATELNDITGFQLELLLDPNLPCLGPGRSVTGACALTEFIVEVLPANGNGESRPVKWTTAVADYNPPEEPLAAIFDDRSGDRRVTGPIEMAIDGKNVTAWGTDAGPGRRNQPRKAVFVPASPVHLEPGERLAIRLRQNHGGWNSDDNQSHNLGCFRLSASTQVAPTVDPLPAHLREFIEIPIDQRTNAQTAALFSEFRRTVPDWQPENDKIESLWKSHPEPATQLALIQRAAPRETHVLTRGEYLQPAEKVDPNTPAFLHPFPAGRPRNRLAFAEWLVDRQSPTVARAIVNRVWQAYFGVGITETPEDLGMRGAEPSHRELLDWLAADLMDHGWSLKRLHHTIVTSATYRQASQQDEGLRNRDPYNRLLARGSRYRLDAEIVRDVALSVSGLLTETVGGPSVHPPLPEFMVQPPISYGPKPWHEDQGPDRYRRALYTFRFRSVPYPALEAFDAPNGDFACVRRTRSNTPLQALVVMNEDIYVECAQALAHRMLVETPAYTVAADSDRLRYGMQLCVSRPPTPTELEALTELLDEQRSYLTNKANPNAPTDAAMCDESTPSAANENSTAEPAVLPQLVAPPGVTAQEFRAWTIVARVLLNLDETLTRE